jgi:hypothetical protein
MDISCLTRVPGDYDYQKAVKLLIGGYGDSCEIVLPTREILRKKIARDLNDYQIPKKRHVFVLISLAGTL